MTWWEWCIALSAVFVGACAQGSFGFGLGVTAAPVLALVDDSFVPGAVLLVATVLTMLVAARERSFDWRSVSWAIAGRVPGSVLGTWAVVVLPKDDLIVLFGVLVLLGVGVSVAGWSIEPRRGALLSAGAVSGFMGSITSIGGPPMALVYQHRTGRELRSSLSLFFLFGSFLSVTLLLVAGELDRGDLRHALALLPAMLLGFAASRWAVRWLDGGRLRPWLLGFSAGTSILLLLTQLL